MPTFGENLRALRKSRGYTQQKFADAIGSNQANITSWEIGNRMPNLATIQMIAETFKVPLSSLISIGDTGEDDDFITELADTMKREPKLRVLFDRVKYLNQDDVRVLIRIAQAFANERIEFGDKV